MPRRKNPMILGLGFDGVVVANRPLGKPFRRIGAEEWIPRFQEDFEMKVILHTCRMDDLLAEAIEECKRQRIEIWNINYNPDSKVFIKTKPFCDLYLDDRAVGAPLIVLKNERTPCIDWNIAGKLIHDGCLAHDIVNSQGVYTDFSNAALSPEED